MQLYFSKVGHAPCNKNWFGPTENLPNPKNKSTQDILELSYSPNFMQKIDFVPNENPPTRKKIYIRNFIGIL